MNVHIDIEAVPPTYMSGEERLGYAYKRMPAEHRRDAVQAALWLRQNAEEAWTWGATDPLVCEPICVAVATDDGEPTVLAGRTMLDQLDKWLKANCTAKPVFVGHSLRAYDLPALAINAHRVGLADLANYLTKILDYRFSKEVVELNTLWPGFDRTPTATMARVLGIPGKVGLSGAEVWPAYQRGEHQRIADYCAGDVVMQREIWKRLMGKTTGTGGRPTFALPHDVVQALAKGGAA